MIRREDYKHYRNLVDSGIAFCTFTVLDFVHAFADPEIADLMAASLLEDCMYYDSKVFAFVIMPHHVHMLSSIPPSHDVSWLIGRIKANSSKRILKRLSPRTHQELGLQHGLNQRLFWQRSFRSVQIESRDMMAQKMNYIHMNPVKAGLAASPDEYKWSSCQMIVAGLADPESGLHLSHDMVRRFANEEELDYHSR